MPAPAKHTVAYTCSVCGREYAKWQGRCVGCDAFNTIPTQGGAVAMPAARRSVIAIAATAPDARGGVGLGSATTTPMVRIPSTITEWDRVVGGGIVPGSVLLLGGDPGVGKSTLALQLAHDLGTESDPVLYLSGEESVAQIAMRADRLGCGSDRVTAYAETSLDAIVATIARRRPRLAVVDSIQTLQTPDVTGGPGSVGQVREAVARLVECAKDNDVAVLVLAHVTKDGVIAGPRTLEHMVDVCLYLEGDRQSESRLLRGLKNRFGATDEVGIFIMDGDGLTDSQNPACAFITADHDPGPGTVRTVTCEGVRPMLVEVQALTVASSFGMPRRTPSGFPIDRLHVVLAVLEKRCKVSASQADVYVSTVGGLRLAENAVDAAVAVAVASSLRDRIVPAGTVVIGEVGLGGELRRVRRMQQRVSEALQRGATHVLLPAGGDLLGVAGTGARISRCRTLADVLTALSLSQPATARNQPVAG